MGHINTIMKLIKYAHSLMEAEGQSSETMHRMICTIMGNYGRHMAFVTDPLFCMAYPLTFVHKDDPTQMTFRSQQNHSVSFTGDGLLVHQLLVHGFTLHKYMRWIGAIGASSFLGVCIFFLTSFHRLLSLIIMRHHITTPRQERMLHLSPLVLS